MVLIEIEDVASKKHGLQIFWTLKMNEFQSMSKCKEKILNVGSRATGWRALKYTNSFSKNVLSRFLYETSFSDDMFLLRFINTTDTYLKCGAPMTLAHENLMIVFAFLLLSQTGLSLEYCKIITGLLTLVRTWGWKRKENHEYKVMKKCKTITTSLTLSFPPPL